MAVLISFALHGAASAYESEVPQEYLIKAAFLYNFAKFVEWPANAFTHESDPIILCILGTDPFGNALDSIEGKMINNRKLEIKRCETVEEAKNCHILFVSSSKKTSVPQILNAFKNLAVMTVGDMEDFGRLGGIINFIIVENKVRFEINLDSAQKAGLKISSKLLKLAIIVNEKGQQEER
jgi:hypothetical protein